MSETPLLPILIGVTGHRDIHPAALPRVRQRVREALQGLIVIHGVDRLRLLSAAASGADLEVSEIALDLGIKLVCLSPMAPERYRQTLEEADRARYDRVCADQGVALRLTLPPVAGVDDGADADVAQYEQLAILLARLSHILLALWDGRDDDPSEARPGRPRSIARGGTAHVVGIRQNGEHAEVASQSIANSALFSTRLPRLELACCGPLLHIQTPRLPTLRQNHRDELVRQPGEVRWWSDMRSHEEDEGKPVGHPERLWKTLAESSSDSSWSAGLTAHMPHEFMMMKDAEDVLRHAESARADQCASAVKGLTTVREDEADVVLIDEGASQCTRFISRLFGAVDCVSFQHQQALLGDWAPGLPWRRGAALRRLGALFWFALALPVMGALFEVYCEFGKDYRLLVAYLCILSLTTVVYLAWVKRNRWQNRYQDYRALAEAARVQFYWAVSGIPLSVSDNYLRQHEGELGWIRFAVRGAALHGIANALQSPEVSHSAVIHVWMRGQKAYFEKALKRYKRAHTTLKRCAAVTVTLLVGSIGALALTQALFGGQLPEEWGETLREAPSVFIGVLPAILAFFLAFQELRLFEEHMHAFEQSSRVFEKAEIQAESLAEALSRDPHDPVLRREWRGVSIALGKESLAENAAWIQLHRAHPIVPKAGG